MSCLPGATFAKSYSTHLSVRDLTKDFGTKVISMPSLDYAGMSSLFTSVEQVCLNS